MHFYCEKCKREYPLDTMSYRCACGGLFRLFKRSEDEIKKEISLGEVCTPLRKVIFDRMEVTLKLDQLQPTGSFKDRGAFTLVNALHNLGIQKIVEDSAGNAAAAIASYAAAAGMDCLIYLPADVSAAKEKQIAAVGAKITKIEGSRDFVATQVRRETKARYYASHVFNPLFFEGIKSMAREIYEQLGNSVPDYIFIPVGNGTMLLGLYYGFVEIGRLPKFVAVQSEQCQPLCQVLENKPVHRMGKTIAASIQVGRPPRLLEMVKAVKNSQGSAMAVSEEEILSALDFLGKQGIYAEISAAAALAGARKFFGQGKPDNYKVVIPITGSGMK